TRRVFVTSQNHGFAVDEKSLSPGTDVWFRNANDGTIEGLIDERLPMLCAQFHPESAPGPRDSSWIFREFMNHI
ncbi:MAG TPA: carbamoyl phosphate synthase small subunit, partial [Spirochaetia bacterium]|nr:carbamoyl phosphate synthase small subunit [Spirochaetia bacterium]